MNDQGSTAIMASPCWCWRSPRSSDDACGFCGWPKRAHHDNGYRSEDDREAIHPADERYHRPVQYSSKDTP